MTKILIIGLGLVGGSFAKALRQHDKTQQIWAFDSNIATIDDAKNAKIIDGLALLDEDLPNFDLIVIATPLPSYKDILQKISNLNPKNTTIIDLGSLKEFIFKILPANLEQNFVACHPIAGSDKSGFENSSADLFLDKKFVICKTKDTEKKSLKIVENVINKIGAKPDFIEAKAHDEIYGLVSHLPQFLSFLTKEFSPKTQDDDFVKKAFRLDDSGAEIWESIFKMNKKNLEKFYLEFFDHLEYFSKKIRQKEDILSELIEISDSFAKTAEAPQSMDKNDSAAIFFRLIIVASYLKINKIKDFQNYAGGGFKDFTSIISAVKLEKAVFLRILEQNQKEILSFIKKISS